MKYQITYEDALRIAEAYKNFNFYKTEWNVDGFKVVAFNYFLCEYNWFVKPLENEPRIHGRDMRGVTFVFNEDGTLYKRFLMLEKFFNINQVAETQYNLVKDKKIRCVTYKEDGSLIAFIQLPNEKVIAKTQGGIDNEQSLAANKIYEENEELRNYVNDVLSVDFTPLFEYTACDNRIVLKYTGRQLRLIGVRDNKNGNYYSAIELDKTRHFEFPIVKSISGTVDDLLALAKTEENIEGWVIEFEDGQMIKIKTDWYCNLHGIRTISIFREDFVIENYLKGTLDDAIQDLNTDDDADAFIFMEKVKNAVINWSNHIEDGVNSLVTAYKEENSFYFNNWAKFATDKHKAPYFGLARTKIEKPEEYKYKKVNYMLNAAKHLMQAKKLVEKWQ